jgi:hypothetical protein
MIIGQITPGSGLYCIGHEMIATTKECFGHEMIATTKVCFRVIVHLLISIKICVILFIFMHKMRPFASIGLVLDRYHPQICFCAFIYFPQQLFIPHYLNTPLYPALHSLTADTSECDNIPGMTCPDLTALGSSGRSISHL